MPAQSIQIGAKFITLDIPPEKIITAEKQVAIQPIEDLSQKMHEVLESPLDFPALRRALTPDDHVAIIVQEDMNSLPTLLQSILQHILQAGIKLQNVALLMPPRIHATNTRPENRFELPAWHAHLPSEFQSCQVEEHRYEATRMAYLASTRQGRRIYLNRTLVDADQVIILGSARFDPFFGVASGLADLFPAFSDQATKQELLHLPLPKQTIDAKKVPTVWQEACAVGWLLGMPFVVAVLEGSDDDILDVWAGGTGAVQQEADLKLREVREFRLTSKVDLVIGTIGRYPERQSFAQVASAAVQASHITRSDGAVAILSEVQSELPWGAEIMKHAPDPLSGLGRLRQDPQGDWISWWQLAIALEKNRIYLYSRIPAQTLEDLWIIPIEKVRQVQNLVNQARSLAVIEDLHRSMPLLRETGH